MQPRRAKLRPIRAFLAVMLVLFVCWLLVGVKINIPAVRPIDQLTSARATWEAQPHTSYDMWVQVGSFSMGETFKISVKDERIVAILHSNRAEVKAADAAIMRNYQSVFGGFFPTTMNDLTMDNLFDFAADKLETIPAPPMFAMCSNTDVKKPHYEVSYDQTHGNITSLKYTSCVHFDFGGGWMCPLVSDCNAVINIEKLEVKEE